MSNESVVGGQASLVRTAGARDETAVAAVLARAFHADPVFSWLIPDPAARAVRLPRLFALFFRTDGDAGMRLLAAGGHAATLWRAPGRATTGGLEVLRALVPLASVFRGGMGRAFQVSSAVEAHFPPQPFWYLHIAGCDPAHQGQGLGSAAVRAGLDRVAGRLPAYLETAAEANLSFYQALGFGVVSDWRVGVDGPRFWSMLRPRG